MSEHTTEDTINRLKSLTEKLSLVQDRITIDHAVIEIQTAIAEAVELRAERDEARQLYCEQMSNISRQQDCTPQWFAEEMKWDCFKEEP